MVCVCVVFFFVCGYDEKNYYYFGLVWADHADYVSTAYSGTGALKTDFTRTGKRTRVGLLQDGYNSAMRYLKNNYFDGARQVRLGLGFAFGF